MVALRYLLELFLLATLGNVLFLVSTLVSGHFLGAKATKAQLGVGPKVLVFSVEAIRIEVAAVPILSSVAYEGMNDTENPARGYRTLHPARRIAHILLGWAPLFAVALVLLGPASALHHLVRAYPQAITLCSNERGRVLLRAFFALSPLAKAGVFLAKFVAFNFLPFGTMAGERLVHTTAEWALPGFRLPRSLRGIWLATSPLLPLALVLDWLITVVRWMA